MDDRMSAGQMMVFLHHYACLAPFSGPGNSAFHRECVAFLIAADLLVQGEDEDGATLRPTEKGRVFAEAVLATPLPQLRWVNVDLSPVARVTG